MDDSSIITSTTTTLTMDSESSKPAASTLRRRNSIATSVVLPKQLSLPATPRKRSSFHAPPNDTAGTETPPSLLDLELISLKSPSSVSYTSLKDVIPSTSVFNSPSLSSASGYDEISIRNRLVKQAAWAYLQPMSASPSGPSGPSFFRHFWAGPNPLTACLSFLFHHLIPGITRILHRIFDAITGLVSL